MLYICVGFFSTFLGTDSVATNNVIYTVNSVWVKEGVGKGSWAETHFTVP